MEPQKIKYSENNVSEKDMQASMFLISKYATKLQYGTGTKRKLRYKPTFIWPINLPQRRQEYTVEKNSLFNKWYLEN